MEMVGWSAVVKSRRAKMTLAHSRHSRDANTEAGRAVTPVRRRRGSDAGLPAWIGGSGGGLAGGWRCSAAWWPRHSSGSRQPGPRAATAAWRHSSAVPSAWRCTIGRWPSAAAATRERARREPAGGGSGPGSWRAAARGLGEAGPAPTRWPRSRPPAPGPRETLHPPRPRALLTAAGCFEGGGRGHCAKRGRSGL